MLLLQPPFQIIEGAAVFRDHANERQFYFMPATPKLSTVRDATTGVDVPQIQLLKFRGNAGNGGLLTFQVDLGLEQERLGAIAAELKRIHRLTDEPLLAPVILENGTVRLIILGNATPPTSGSPTGTRPSPGDEEEPRFVIKINQPATPALYGDNQAIFSVELDENGVQLVEASLLGELMPIGVVYSLDFLALRPAFTVKVTADWQRVQSRLEEKFSADVLFSSVEIDTAVDKLIEERAIEIEVDSFLPEDEDTGSWVGRRDHAINDFKDMVTENFFQPSVDPMNEKEDDWDKFSNTAERLALLAASGGLAGSCKFGYVKRDLTRIDQKRLGLKMNERVTVKRSIYPQANLRGLTRVLRDAQGNIDLSRFVTEVTLDDDWFARRRLTAHALVDFDNDRVESVNVTLTYDGRPQTLRLTKAEPSGSREWNSVVGSHAMVRPVEYEYRVNFRDVDTAERPGMVGSALLSQVGDEFEVSPRGERLYFMDDIQFGAGQLDWNRFPQVFIEVRYDDPPNGIHLAETFLLNRDKPDATWKRFRRDPVVDEYQVRVTYLAADNRDILVDWRVTDQERLLVRDPRPSKRTVQVVPAVDWRLVAMVIVELRYTDEENGIDELRTLSFFDSPEDRGPKVFSANLANPDHRFVGYSATILLKDNRTLMVLPSMTAGSTVVVRADMIGHRVVALHAPKIDFATYGLVRLEAQMAYADRDAGLTYEDRFTFLSPADVNYFEFDYVSSARSQYSCKILSVLANGLVQERDLGSLDGSKLVLTLA
jgi:hypothetical protein